MLVHPFDHPDIVAGQGTVGLEILEQVPDVRTVVVCTGGGGLLAGIALAVKSLRPDVRVVGVQAESAAAFPASLAAGHPVPLDGMATMADGIAVGCPGPVPFALVRELVDEIVTVSEESLSRALLLCLERAKLVVEPAGAAGVAALLDDPRVVRAAGGGRALRRQHRPAAAACGCSGTGWRSPAATCRSGRGSPTSRARWCSCWPRWPRPTPACSRSSTCAPTRGCGSTRSRSRLQLETRGEEHCDQVLARLREAGYPLVFG